MKTSIDLPDDLYRRVKSKSALQGLAVREVATALFVAWLEQGIPDISEKGASSTDSKSVQTSTREWLETWGRLGATIAEASGGTPGLVEQLRVDRR